MSAALWFIAGVVVGVLGLTLVLALCMVADSER